MSSPANPSIPANPLLTLPFAIPFPEIRPEHIEPAVDSLLARSQTAIDTIANLDPENCTHYDAVLGALERATEDLELAMTVVGHLESVATTPELRAAYNAAQPKVSAFYSQIPTNAGIWRSLKTFAASPAGTSLDGPKRRLLDKTIREFRRHGAELNEADKATLLSIDVELSNLTTTFSQNTLDSTNAFELYLTEEQLAGLPESARIAAREDAARRDKAGYRFSLQAPSLTPLLSYLDAGAIREQVWRAYTCRATSGDHDNRPLLARILALRSAKAKLLGYKDFADLVLAERMAKTGAEAAAFIEDLTQRSEAAFARESLELLQFRRELEGPNAPALQPWDIGYYAEKLRQARFDFDEEALRPYFSADRVLNGLFEVARRLYGIRTEAVALPVWDASVTSYRLRDEKDRDLGCFYVDLYPRENKRGGAWMNALITGLPDQPERDRHLGLFCANVHPPSNGRPGLLNHRDVETLFHEFGHLLHHMLSEVQVRSLAGTNVAWDFVELPSQIMENWCWEREALALFAHHVDTGAELPLELFTKMRAARTFRGATMMMRQLGFASADLALHRQYDPARDGEVLAYARRLAERYSSTPLPENYGMMASFTHLFSSPTGYAAAYYSYKWAEVLDADAFGRFRSEGLFNPKVGADFRREILAKGDSEDPAHLFHAFRGRPPMLDALLERSGLSA